MTRHNLVCLGGLLLSASLGISAAKYFYPYAKSSEDMSIPGRLESKAFDILCIERYPIEKDIYHLTQELSSELNKEKNYENLLNGTLDNMRESIKIYENNCKK